MAEALQSLQLSSKLVDKSLESLIKFRRESDLTDVRWKAISDKVQTFRKGFLGIVTDIVGAGPKMDAWHFKIQKWVEKAKVDENEMVKLTAALNAVDPKPWQKMSIAIAAALWALRNPLNELNRSLIQGNNYLETRRDLLVASTQAMTRTGASTEQATRAIRALVFYGLETDRNFSQILEHSLKLEKTFGISTEHSAEMFFIYRKLNIESASVADNIATIVNQTSLAADEARRYATELGKAAIFLPKGGVGSIAGAQVFLGRMEGLVKEAMGQQGELTAMMADMMGTGSGSMRALMLGAQPSDLSSDAGQRRAIERLLQLTRPAFAAREAGATTQSLQMLEAFSEMFTGGKVSPRTLIALNESYGKLADQQNKQLTLADKWSNELTNTGELLGVVTRSVKNLLTAGMIPAVQAFNWVLSVVGKVLSATSSLVEKWKGLSYVISVVLVGATGTAIYGIYSLVKAVVLLGRAASFTAGQVLAQAAAQRAAGGAQMMLPGMGPAAATGGGWVLRSLTALRSAAAVITLGGVITTLVASGVIAAIVGAVWWQSRKLGKALDEEERIRKATAQFSHDIVTRGHKTMQEQAMDLIRKNASKTEIQENIDRWWAHEKKQQRTQFGYDSEGKVEAMAAKSFRALAPTLQIVADQLSAQAQLTIDPTKRSEAAKIAEAALQQVHLMQEMIEQQTQTTTASKRQARAQEESAQRQEDQMLRWLIYGDWSAIFRQDAPRGVRTY